MPFEMLRLATSEGIKVEYWDFEPPLEGIYLASPGIPSVIGISKRIFESSPRFRCVLAEELGHHFTTVGDTLPRQFYHYRDRLSVSKAEYRALRWAAEYLMPEDKLREAIRSGCVETWSIADRFNVTEDMVRFRVNLAKEIYV